MARVEFPEALKELLQDSDLQPPVRALADQAGRIFADNKTIFFPFYTDHGIDHINQVLQSEVELIPAEVWHENAKQPRLLRDADAAVIIGATLLHDIAMHLSPAGFLELVGRRTRFQPLRWFKDRQRDHAPDRRWPDLWDDYVREARRFSDRTLTNIIGEEAARSWKFDGLPEEIGRWETNHLLVIGEFIRRHHTRLAHEIAIYGFPGLPVGSGEGYFPGMGTEVGHPLNGLADLIGLTARSHGLSLRVCQAYLDVRYPRTPRPMGTAALYPMALLRVADYLQIDRQRAPAVLLQLRTPQSPASLQEWQKHLAVQSIDPADDPRGRMVTVSENLSLPLFLQLRDLLAGVQQEMDHATAVLDEAYGARTDLRLNLLTLSVRRVYSNLHEPEFRDNLRYVAEQTGFTADPHLLALLVEPLYGKYPEVGVRELVQNAADAVRELKAWTDARGGPRDLELLEQDADVLVDFIRRDDGTWFLQVRDRGIGMTSDTLQHYFLRAGASFRSSSEWGKEFLDDSGRPRVTRAGRFGVGVFAVFLLGPTFRLWTRHAGAENSSGYAVAASHNSQLIEITRVDDLPIGTTVEVDLSSDATEGLELDAGLYDLYRGPGRKTDWFCWDWPKIVRRVVREPSIQILPQEYAFQRSPHGPKWSTLYPSGFDAVYWTFRGGAPDLSCNGIKVANPEPQAPSLTGSWKVDKLRLRKPGVAVVDTAAKLPLSIQRYDLSKPLPFLDELAQDAVLSFLAHALVHGPASLQDVLAYNTQLHPLQSDYAIELQRSFGVSDFDISSFGGWCATSSGMVTADPWLYSLLDCISCIVAGSIFSGSVLFERQYNNFGWPPHVRDHDKTAVLPMLVRIKSRILGEEKQKRRLQNDLVDLFRQGLSELGGEGQESSSAAIKADPRLPFDPDWRRYGSQKNLMMVPGAFTSALPLEELLGHDPVPEWGGRFVIELRTPRAYDIAPKALIAKVWNECLGPRPIPFDPVARRALIEDARKHPELKRHIDAWYQMAPDGTVLTAPRQPEASLPSRISQTTRPRRSRRASASRSPKASTTSE